MRRRRRARARPRRLCRVRRREGDANHSRHRFARARRSPIGRTGPREEGGRRVLPPRERERSASRSSRSAMGKRSSSGTRGSRSGTSSTCPPSPRRWSASCDSTRGSQTSRGRDHERPDPARPSREPRAILAARRRQRVRRCDGRHGAQHPAGDRRARLSPRGARGRTLVHRRLRRHEGADQLPRRSALRSFRPQARARRRLARRCAGAVSAHVGAELVVGALRERAARREPGAHVVDDRDHENRSRRPEEPRPGDGIERVCGLFRGRCFRDGNGLDRRALGSTPATLLPGRRVRGVRPRPVRHPRPRDEASRHA